MFPASSGRLGWLSAVTRVVRYLQTSHCVRGVGPTCHSGRTLPGSSTMKTSAVNRVRPSASTVPPLHAEAAVGESVALTTSPAELLLGGVKCCEVAGAGAGCLGEAGVYAGEISHPGDSRCATRHNPLLRQRL
jgi:hypothetical protein